MIAREIHFRGRRYRVQGRFRVGGREYLNLGRLSGGPRRKFRVFDPQAGPNGDLRALTILEQAQPTVQHLEVLKRISVGNRNLPQILEYQCRDKDIWVVTTWIWGDNLRSHMDQARHHPRLWPTPGEAFKLFRGLAHGLCQLHHLRNVVHGDVKPANLILAREPNRLVLIDFGSAWTVERTRQRQEGDGRTEGYQAPEHYEGLADFRGDIFSASVVAYEMLTGNLPFAGMGGRAGLPRYRQVFAGQLAGPSSLCPRREQIPGRCWAVIDQVILRGLALDPRDRFADPDSWIRELNLVDAYLKLPPRLGVLNKAFVRLLLWMRAKFGPG